MSSVRCQPLVRAEPAGWLAGRERFAPKCRRAPLVWWPPSAGRRGARLRAREMSRRPSVSTSEERKRGGEESAHFLARGSSRLVALARLLSTHQHATLAGGKRFSCTETTNVSSGPARASGQKFASLILLKFALDLIYALASSQVDTCPPTLRK